jgi:hypothetical protein
VESIPYIASTLFDPPSGIEGDRSVSVAAMTNESKIPIQMAKFLQVKTNQPT